MIKRLIRKIKNKIRFKIMKPAIDFNIASFEGLLTEFMELGVYDRDVRLIVESKVNQYAMIIIDMYEYCGKRQMSEMILSELNDWREYNADYFANKDEINKEEKLDK